VVANTFYKIIQDWVTNLNDDIEHLAFHIIGQSLMIHYVDYVIGMHFGVTSEGFYRAIKIVKAQCIVACDVLNLNLEWKFPNHELMNFWGLFTHNIGCN
jgi:hypothetical protein